MIVKPVTPASIANLPLTVVKRDASGNININASNISAGTLLVTNGGTGLSTIASGKLLYASALNTLSALTLGTGLSITGGTLNASTTNPAGSSSEIQYRSSGTSFGAISGSSVSGSSITLTGIFTANGGIIIRQPAYQNGNLASGSMQEWQDYTGVAQVSIGADLNMYAPRFRGGGDTAALADGLYLNSSKAIQWAASGQWYTTQDVRIRRTAANTLTLDDGSGGAANLTVTGTINAPQWYGSTHDAIFDSAGSWIFYTDDAERMRINSSGVTLGGNLNFNGHEAIEVQDITLVSGLTPDSTGIATYSQSIDLGGAGGNGNLNNAGTVTADAFVGDGSGITNIIPTSEVNIGTASTSLGSSMAAVSPLTVSIPSAGTWEIYGRIRYFCSGGNVIIRLYDDTNSAAIAGTDTLLCASATIHGTGTPTWIITTAGAVTIHLHGMDTSGGGSTILSDLFGWSALGVKKVPV